MNISEEQVQIYSDGYLLDKFAAFFREHVLDLDSSLDFMPEERK